MSFVFYRGGRVLKKISGRGAIIFRGGPQIQIFGNIFTSDLPMYQKYRPKFRSLIKKKVNGFYQFWFIALIVQGNEKPVDVSQSLIQSRSQELVRMAGGQGWIHSSYPPCIQMPMPKPLGNLSTTQPRDILIQGSQDSQILSFSTSSAAGKVCNVLP